MNSLTNRNLFIAVLLTLLFHCLAPAFTQAQSLNTAQPFFNYYYDYKLANPAFTGIYDPLRVTIAYDGSPFRDGVKSNNLYFSYEARLDAINSGFGIRLTHGELGDIRVDHGAAIFYQYKISLSDESSLHLGTQFSYQSTRIDYTELDLMNPDDVLFMKNNRLEFGNVDLGLTYRSPLITLGMSAKNLIDQKIQVSDTTPDNYSSLNFIATRNIIVSDKFKLTPSLFYQLEDQHDQIAFNCSFEIFKRIIFGVGYQVYLESEQDNQLTLNAGLNFNEGRIQFITHFYSSAMQKLRDNTSGDNSYAEALLRFRVLD